MLSDLNSQLIHLYYYSRTVPAPNTTTAEIWPRALLFVTWFYILLSSSCLLNWRVYFLQVLLFFSIFSKIFYARFCAIETTCLSELNVLYVSFLWLLPFLCHLQHSSEQSHAKWSLLETLFI